jgi:hypothetical protein
MTDRLHDLADDHQTLHEFCERDLGRPLEPEELVQLAEDVVEMHDDAKSTSLLPDSR